MTVFLPTPFHSPTMVVDVQAQSRNVTLRPSSDLTSCQLHPTHLSLTSCPSCQERISKPRYSVALPLVMPDTANRDGSLEHRLPAATEGKRLRWLPPEPARAPQRPTSRPRFRHSPSTLAVPLRTVGLSTCHLCRLPSLSAPCSQDFLWTATASFEREKDQARPVLAETLLGPACLFRGPSPLPTERWAPS